MNGSGTEIESRIGQTPLLRLDALVRDLPGIKLFAKAEWHNPGGSVKDRAAAAIFANAEKEGLLASRRLLDSTSGNTGIAYAMLGAAERIPVTLCVPANVSVERKRILAAYGAEVIWTDPAEGSDGAIRKAQDLAAARPDLYYYADQYSNPANWQAHYCGTAVEIWRQTEGRVTHFVAGLGTSGTFMGTARRLKELAPKVRCISLQPDSPFHGLEGLKHMASAIVPRIYDASLADENREISTEAAYALARRLAREEGFLLGPSSAAALLGAVEVARGLHQQGQKEAVIVTVLPDSADKYLSERFWVESP